MHGEDRGRKTEDRKQKTEVRGQKTEDSGQKTAGPEFFISLAPHSP
jgi:hypothetical protein